MRDSEFFALPNTWEVRRGNRSRLERLLPWVLPQDFGRSVGARWFWWMVRKMAISWRRAARDLSALIAFAVIDRRARLVASLRTSRRPVVNVMSGFGLVLQRTGGCTTLNSKPWPGRGRSTIPPPQKKRALPGYSRTSFQVRGPSTPRGATEEHHSGADLLENPRKTSNGAGPYALRVQSTHIQGVYICIYLFVYLFMYRQGFYIVLCGFGSILYV